MVALKRDCQDQQHLKCVCVCVCVCVCARLCVYVYACARTCVRVICVNVHDVHVRACVRL